MNTNRSFAMLGRAYMAVVVLIAIALTQIAFAQVEGDAFSCALLTPPNLITVTPADPAIQTVTAGDEISLRFTITNDTSWTLPDTTIQAVLVPVNESTATGLRPVFASSLVLDSLAIGPEYSRVVDVTLPVPATRTAGLYEVALVATQSDADTKRVTMLIDASEQVVSVPVSVLGGTEMLTIEDDELTVGEADFTVSDVISLTTGEPTEVSLTITNTATASPAFGTLKWQLYEGPVPAAHHLVAEATQAIKLLPEAAKVHEFTLAHQLTSMTDSFDVLAAERMQFPEYLLMVTITDEIGVAKRMPMRIIRGDTEPTRTPYSNTLLVQQRADGSRILGCVAPQFVHHPLLDTATFMTVSVGGIEVDAVLRTEDDRIDSDEPLLLEVAPTPGPLSVVFSSARGDVEQAGNPAFSRLLVSELTATIGCDIHSCIAPVADDEAATASVSPLKTMVGMVMLLIIAALPVVGAYQVLRRSRTRRRSIMDDSDNEMHPLDSKDDQNT